jgi:hypothetical protein
MFGRKQTSQPPVKPAASKPEAAVADYVIHALPKEYRDRPITYSQTEKKPTPAPAPNITTPQPTSKSGVLLPLNRAPSKPKAVTPPKKKKMWIAVVFGVLLLFLTLGLVAYSLGWFAARVEPEPVVEPTPEPEPEPTPEPTPEPEPTPTKVTNGVDTDSDGLTNVEELMYGTDFRNPDSDGDTYLDGNEVFHRYNPVALAPSTLLDTGAVRVLNSADLPFSISYPVSWNPITQPAIQKVTFRSDATSASVVISWQAKPEDQSLADWYEKQIAAVSLERLQDTTTKEGYELLIAPDERIMYLAADGSVYTLVYDLGTGITVEFLQTFKMMANSFRLAQ